MNLDELGDTSIRRARQDLAFAGAIGIVWIAGGALGFPLGVTIPMVLAGLIALTVRLRSGGDTLSDMGLRIDNVGATAPPILGLTTLVSLALLGVGYAAGRALTGEAIVLFLLYPLWGIAQQFLMQGIVHRRLRSAGASPGVAIVVTGAAFAALHLPDEKLTVLTWIAGTGWAWLFSRWPNAWLLGLSHGVLAALTYLLVLGSPPLG